MIKKIYKQFLPESTRNNIRLFLQKIIYPLYLGNRYYCNCCGKTFRKFRSKGNQKRENVMCPYCLSLERTRVMDLFLNDELEAYTKSGLKILHFAPEACIKKKFLKNNTIEYIDGDINPNYADNIIDITQIQYPDAYFDLIICSHVLGHVPNEKLGIQEMYRVLKETGTALIMTLRDKNSPHTFEDENITDSADRLKYYSEADLCRLHGLDFADRLRKQNFKVKEIDYRLNVSKETQNRLRLGDGSREMVFKCTK